MNAFELQTQEYTHTRPPIDLGNLRGPDGNAFIVNGRVKSNLKDRGFIKESQEFSDLVFSIDPNYDKSFNKIAFFFNLAPAPKVINLNDLSSFITEEGDDVVIKISKKDIFENQRQLKEYNESLDITNTVNAHESNYLGRNISFYFNSIKDTLNFSHTQMQELLSTGDHGNSRSYMHIFYSDSDNHIPHLLEKTLLLQHFIDKHKNVLDLSIKDIFDRNALTQLFIFSHSIEGAQRKVNSGEEAMFYETLYRMKHCVSELKKLPGFNGALEHNRTRFLRYCEINETMKELLGKKELKIPNKYLANIEKVQLELLIKNNNNQSSVLKI